MNIELLNTLFLDIEKTISDAGGLPDFKDGKAVAAWAGRIAPDIVQFIYDAGGLSQVKPALMAMAANPEAAAAAGWKPDGTIIKWVITNLPAIMQIISLFVK